MNNLHPNQRGQVLLLVVLVVTVALTVGLSAVTQSITNLRITEEEESSQRAFTAAEAGIEQALKTGEGISASLSVGDNAKIKQVTISDVSDDEIIMNSGNPIQKNDSVDLWLSEYSNYSNYSNPFTGSLSVYWGGPGEAVCTPENNSQAALEIVLLTGPANNPAATHFVYDPCPPRQSTNFFAQPSATGGNLSLAGKNFAYRADIPGITNGLIARIIPLYAATPLGVQASTILPSQGKYIESVGESGQTQHKISVFRGYPKLPNELFPNILLVP